MSNKNSQAKAFGIGAAGIILLFIGFAFMFGVYHYFTNLEQFSDLFVNSSNKDAVAVVVLFIYPGILLAIASACFYYGIKLVVRS